MTVTSPILPTGLRARDLMTRDLVTVGPQTPVGEALTKMRDLGVRHMPVLADGRFAGMVDDRLVAAALMAGDDPATTLTQPVVTAMMAYVPQVDATADVSRVARLLRSSRCDAVVVVDAEERLLGIITTVDLVAAVAADSARP